MKHCRCANCGAEADHPDDARHMVECPDPAMFSTQQSKENQSS